jgi:heptaprenyl diphosphate synthase
MNERERVRRLTTDAIFLSLALVLAVVERWIPLELLVPVPGLKLGLANIVSLFALVRMRPIDALVILILRCLIIGTFTGPTALLFSLAGGLLALGISLAGAAAHNLGQISVAVLILGEPRLLFTYLPPLLLTSLATGTLTGIAAIPLIQRFKHMPGMKPANRRSLPNSLPHSLLILPVVLSLSLTLGLVLQPYRQ